MYHRFIRFFSAILISLITSSTIMYGQPCPDTQPVISGASAVRDLQSGVIYSTPNIPGHTYNWTVTGGNIISGTGTSQITVNWGPVGTGNVSLTETNSALSCSTTVSKSVKVQPLLVAYFYYTNTSCYGDELSFYASSPDSGSFAGADGIASYLWNFGDGQTSTLPNPKHTYAQPWNTTWTVTLIVTNTSGYKDTIYDAVYVNPFQYIPVARFNTVIPNCLYDAVTFDATSSTTPPATDSLVRYVWNFGDPSSPTNIINSATAKTPSHVFTAPGTYTVSLTVYNVPMCSNTITHQVTITPSIPAAQYTYSTPTCINNPTFFTDLTAPPSGHSITEWEWRFGDGSANQIISAPALPNIPHTYPALGPFQTWLIVTNNLGCKDTIVKSISLTPSPIADFSTDNLCFGDSVKFTNHTIQNGGPAVVSYSWDFGDPSSAWNTSNNPNTAHVYSATGDFTVRLVVVSESGCPDTIVKTLHIFGAPTVEYNWQLGSQNNMVQFHLDQSVTNTGAIGNMVLWNFGDGGYGYGYDPTHIYPAGGTFNVTLSVTDTNGCKNTITHQIIVPSLPLAFFSTNSPQCFGQPICANGNLSNANTPPFGYIVQWIWNWDDGSPNDTINFPDSALICHTYATVDTFAVTLKVFDNNGYSDTYTREVIILNNPIANFTYTPGCAGQNVNFTDLSAPNGGGNVITHDWDFGDPGSGIDNTSQLLNPVHTFSAGGYYDVRLIISSFNGCVDTITKTVFVRFSPPVQFTHDTACLNELVHYSIDTLITDIDSIATWQWNFGDGTPVVLGSTNMAHLYTAPGTYTTTLTVMDKHGCLATVSHPVIVNPLPVAAFSWAAQACQGSAVQFTSASYVPAGFNGYIARWEWDFGDGTPAQTILIPNTPNIMHSFASTSTSFLVTLRVWSNDSCPAVTQQTVNLIATPVANFEESSAISCQGSSVLFHDISQTNNGGAIVFWSWDFNDPTSGANNTSVLQNPSHIFQLAGPYNVQLIVRNSSGCTDTIIKPITINQLPKAIFSADTACFNNPTTFTSNSIANASSIISYAWTFGDGGNSSLQSPTHTYASYGIFQVHLQITNSNGCVHDTSGYVLVNPAPVAAFSFSSPTCLGAPVQYTNMSTTITGYLGSIVRWTWEFGDGTTQNILFPASPNVSHTFAGNALNHTVRLTVKTSDSCEAYIEHVVTSVPSPIANYLVPVSNCENQEVQFTDQSQQNGGGNLVTWHWDFDDPASGANNISTAQSPVHFFTDATLSPFNVVLIVTNASNCSDTVQTDVAVIAKPTFDFSADTACLGKITTFTYTPGTSGTVNQWLWDFGDGTTSTAQSPTHTYSTSGTFNVLLTCTTSEGCFNDTIHQVVVLPEPFAAFAASAPACAGDTVHLTNLSTTPQGAISIWHWTFGDGTDTTVVFPDNPNVSHVYATGGTYQVHLEVKTSDSCMDEQISPVIIQAAPLANFNFTPNGCESEPVQFNDQSQFNGGAAVTQWYWDFGDPASGVANTSNIANPIHNFSGPSSTGFVVTLQTTNATGCTDTISKTVVINAAPVAIFTADTACLGSPTQFTDASTTPSGNVITWHWDFGEPSSGLNNTSTLQNPIHDYSSTGDFTVILTVTNENGCNKDTSMLISVYPKPNAMFEYTAACVNSPTQFHDQSLAPGSMITSWLWDFGDGSTSTIQDPVHSFTTSGIHQVKLLVSNLNNCQDSVTMDVTTRNTPVANYSYNSFYCPAGTVSFQDMSVGVGAAVVSRLWLFEPGYTSTLVNPVYTFSNTNVKYPVSLIITDNYGCQDTITDSVFVKPGFTFDFTSDSVCYNTPTHFTPLNLTPGDSLYSVKWDFGDPASGQNNYSYSYNATHVYTTPGSHMVKFRAVNSDNCYDSLYKEVIVHALPAPAFSFSSVPCDSVIRFNETSEPGTGTISNWEWNFGDGSAPLTIPGPLSGDTSHQYNIGVYPVTLKVTNSYGCSDIVSADSVELYPCILAVFEHSDTLLCATYPVSFSDSSFPVGLINQWHWVFGDGLDTTYSTHAGTFVHSYTTAGSYSVKLIINAMVSGKNFVDTVTQLVVIHPKPLPAFANPPVCLNNITLFTDTTNASGVPLTMWNWEFGHPSSGTANTSTVTNPMHKYDSAGTYQVKLIVQNQYGCQDSITKGTKVLALPVASFTNTVGCIGDPTYFYDNAKPGDTAIQFWKWNFGDMESVQDTASTPDAVYHYKEAIDYAVSMIVKDRNGCADTMDSTISVYTKPVSAFNVTNNINGMTGKVKLVNASDGATSFYWDFGNNQTSTDESPIVTYSEDGTYLIMLISSNQNQCSDTTFYKYEVLFKGLYIPNAFAPTSSNFAVMLFKPIGINLKSYLVEVFDSWGHRVWTSKELDLQGRPTEGWDGKDASGNIMPSGTYMWKVNAMFIDGSQWQGADIGKGEFKTFGTVTLIR